MRTRVLSPLNTLRTALICIFIAIIPILALGGDETPNSDNTFTFAFENADVREVVTILLDDVLMVNFSIHPDVQGSVTSRATSVNHKELISILRNDLDALGYALMHEDPNFYRVVPKPPLMQNLIKAAMEYPLLASIIAYCFIGFILVFGIYLYRPIWILSLNAVLRKYGDIKFSSLGGLRVPLREILFVGFFEFSDRVLDAWVEKHVAVVQENFNKLPTVEQRRILVPIPVSLNDAPPSLLKGKDFKTIFNRRSVTLIYGEGGSGKTTFALQIALWAMAHDPTERPIKNRMLPIFIEPELAPQRGFDAESLISLINGSLESLTGSVRRISKELLLALLRRRRLLVVLDGFSEMTDYARGTLSLSDPQFPVAVLLLTSRIKHTFPQTPISRVSIPRIEGNRLSSFMEGYLSKLGKRGLFDDEAFFEACRNLSHMAQESSITALLAKMYAELIVSAARSELARQEFHTVPELMIAYVNDLNSRVSEKLDDRQVQLGIKLISFLSVRNTFYPVPISIDVAINTFESQGILPIFEYLKSRLHLIQTVGVQRNQIRMNLDPLAEYLGAIYILENLEQDNEAWGDFLSIAREKVKEREQTKPLFYALAEVSKDPFLGVSVPKLWQQELQLLASACNCDRDDMNRETHKK